MLWSGSEFVVATGGRALGDEPIGVSGISIDTRTLQQGEAFFAISGDRFDGHDFASQAMAAGASVIVIAESKAIVLGHLQVPKIVVQDVLGALENVGRAARARTDARIAAVTGSVGKTTTKEMLRAALSVGGATHAAVASFNNHWGVPLTLSRMPQDSAYAVFEIGMNRPGEITPLVGMVRPHVAAITRIAPAHLGHFDSVREIARAKAEIFSGLSTDGIAVLNRDDEHYDFLVEQAKAQNVDHIVTFGTESDCDIRLVADPLPQIVVEGTPYDLRLPLRGLHNAMNASCAVAVATALGCDVAGALRGIAKMAQVTGRGTVETLDIGGGHITLLDESYNANPVSMAAALHVLSELPVGANGRRIAVLGDMLELGRFSTDMHAQLNVPVLAAQPDLVVLVGPEMEPLAERLRGKIELHHCSDADVADTTLRSLLRPNDVVMLKASNGTGLGRLASALRQSAAA